MKQIKIKQLHLVNFKGIRELKIDFAGDTTIQGANGTGKTTIFDAFTWLLFGKDSTDRKAFNLKTLDKDGKPIERLPHEVAALLEVTTDGGVETIALTRRYNEKWTKRRGSAVEEFTGHEEERLYNDVPVSAKDWQTKIAALCDEQVFKFITNPLYFAAQKTDVQRAMLFRMAGDVSDKQVAAGNAEFAALLANLTGKTMDEFRREIAAKKRRIKAEIDTIPSRIDERRRDAPQPEDWRVIEEQLKSLTNSYNQQLNLFASGESEATKRREALHKQMADVETQLYEAAAAVREEAGKSYNELRSQQRELQYKVNDLESAITESQRTITEGNVEIERCTQLREKLIAEWRAISAEQFTVNDGEFVCPTCHRRYEVDEVEARTAELTAVFNQRKAARLAQNNTAGKANKAHMQVVADRVAKASENAARFTAELGALRQDPLLTAQIVEPDFNKAVSENVRWQSLNKRLAALKAELANVQDTSDDNSTAKVQLADHSAQIDTLKAKLAKRDTIERNDQRIAELESQLRNMSQELADLERVEYTMQQFAKAKVEAIEGKINSLFSLVRFKLFEQQINGGEVETCVATVAGVPFPDLNNAMKINAGLDIISAIAKYEGVSAPIFVDNAEAVNTLLSLDTQVVRLVVTTDEILTIITD